MRTQRSGFSNAQNLFASRTNWDPDQIFGRSIKSSYTHIDSESRIVTMNCGYLTYVDEVMQLVNHRISTFILYFSELAARCLIMQSYYIILLNDVIYLDVI